MNLTQAAVGEYKWGFHDDEEALFMADKGLTEERRPRMSGDSRASRRGCSSTGSTRTAQFLEPIPNPKWAGSIPEQLEAIDFDDIHYYVKRDRPRRDDWEDVPEYIKDTFDKLGIPEAERQFLAGAGAQYDSEVVYHNIARTWRSRA